MNQQARPGATQPPGPKPDHRQRLQQAVQRYERPLVAYALSLTRDLERARDVTQDTLLRLCQQPTEKFERDIQPRLAAWLFTVCRNRVIDLHRKEHRMTATAPGMFEDVPDTAGHTPADTAAAHDQQDQLLGLVQSLPPNQREVVQLRFRGELAYREIAEATGHSVSYVGVLLHDAIKQLRSQMTKLNA